jgi:hypothetical protein
VLLEQVGELLAQLVVLGVGDQRRFGGVCLVGGDDRACAISGVHTDAIRALRHRRGRP